jgi:hypothetical protein
MIKTVQKPKYILSLFSGCLSYYYETDNICTPKSVKSGEAAITFFEEIIHKIMDYFFQS